MQLDWHAMAHVILLGLGDYYTAIYTADLWVIYYPSLHNKANNLVQYKSFGKGSYWVDLISLTNISLHLVLFSTAK